MSSDIALGGKYVAYSEYKNSIIEWVGDIPEQWDVKPLFGVVTTESLKNDGGEETNVLSLSYGNIVRRDVDKNFGLLPASFNTYQLVNAGDLILRLTDLQNDKRSLRVGHATEKGIITSAYLKLVAKQNQLNDRYLYRLLHSYDTTKVFYGMGGGLRQSMAFDDMRRLPTIVPPIEEQKKIANFLDHETAKIDTLIEKQQQLITLLKEKRQAVISHAVTKGLDPDVPMRDSGVEWLGEVPEHWGVLRLKYQVEMLPGYAFKSTGFIDSPKDVSLLRGINITPNKVRWDETVYWPSNSDEDLTEYELHEKDLVLGMDRPWVGSGLRLAMVSKKDLPAYVVQRVARIRGVKGVTQEYLLNLLSAPGFSSYFDPITTGVSVPHISTDQIGEYYFALPPEIERQNIVDFISLNIPKFNKLVERAEIAISLMKERRTALISAAVTGKIDVRNWQAPISENNDKEANA